MGLKLTEKKTRILCEDDVIKAIDRHTNDENTLDNDISCILEEVNAVNIIGSKEAMKNIRMEDSSEMEEDKKINIVTVRWWDGYKEDFRCTEIRFGSDLLWMRLEDGNNRHIPLRMVRWFGTSIESHQITGM